MGFRSPNAAEEHLRALARKGVIEMTPGASRGIKLKQEPGVPVIGRRRGRLADTRSRAHRKPAISSIHRFSIRAPTTCSKCGV
jgi:SOS-response transcriptional repressor LexA